ncbi:flagellar biosynthetic protein FliR [Azospirillum sp. ST 5-10]|uniref:flagellar biosynthetic protein FliR n=1 Tax=unclassified Azospirillum TaxID=2630922 RepID=UPI003F4A4E06
MDPVADPLAQLLVQEVFRAFLVFVRVAAAVGAMPGFGENAVPVPVRLAVALLVTLVLLPAVPGLPGTVPDDPAVLVGLFVGEILVGAFLGLGAKLFLAALQATGGLAAQVIGLSNPFTVDAGGFEGGSVLSGVLLIGGLALLFASDVHYLMIGALLRSYATWPVGVFPELGALARRFAELVAATFRLGVGLAAPFLLFGLVLNITLGLVNRVMPAMPVYFVGTPVLLLVGLGLFMVTSGAMLSGFVDALATWLYGH